MRVSSFILSASIAAVLCAAPVTAVSASFASAPASQSTSAAAAVAPTALDAPSTLKAYKNCTALNKKYPHGVGKKGAKDKTSSKRVTNFTVNTTVYNENKKSDRDKDGIACEKK